MVASQSCPPFTPQQVQASATLDLTPLPLALPFTMRRTRVALDWMKRVGAKPRNARSGGKSRAPASPAPVFTTRTPDFLAAAARLTEAMERDMVTFAETTRTAGDDHTIEIHGAGSTANGESWGSIVMGLDSLGEAAVEVVSPVSGTLRYVAVPGSTEGGGTGGGTGGDGGLPAPPLYEWVNSTDGHSLPGLLLRDLLRMGNTGMPAFAK